MMKGFSDCLLVLILIAFFVDYTYTWAGCSDYGGNCNIPEASNGYYQYSNVAFGQEYGDSRSGTTIFKTFLVPDVNCSPNNDTKYQGPFGDVNPKGICSLNLPQDVSFWNSNSWADCNNGNQGGYCNYPGIHLARYGTSGQYFYQWLMLNDTGIPCQWTDFGAYSDESTNYCAYTVVNYEPEFNFNWNLPCALDGFYCELPSDDSVYWVAYGNPYGDMVINLFQGGSILCNKGSFGWSGVAAGGQCFIAPFEDHFKNNIGYWDEVASCGAKGCEIQYSMVEGVTSTSSISTSQEWSQTYSKSLTKGTKFGFGDDEESHSVTMTQSATESMTTTISHALSVSASKTCTVNCPASSTGRMRLYQWKIHTQEVMDFGFLQDFLTFSCNYICIEGTDTPPLCPLNYCDNAVCDKCKPGWNGTGTVDKKGIPNKYNLKYNLFA